MDRLLRSPKEIKKAVEFIGKLSAFKRSKELIDYCIENKCIAALNHPFEMDSAYFKTYFDHLIALTRQELGKMESLTSIDELRNRKDCRKVFQILWEFGVIGEIRNECGPRVIKGSEPRSATSITLKELYEVSKAVLNFTGSELAFKKQVQRLYGSFAEYCIAKGYDINSTKWESDETALRVAKKIGTIAEVKRRSISLYKYLEENGLLEDAFNKDVA